MKIALINPNHNLKDAAVHLGLAYLASYASSLHNNLDISLLDTRISSKRKVRKYLLNNYDLVGLTSSTQTFTEALEIALQIKELYPETPICLGGAHASTYKEEALDANPFDFVVVGEGEQTFSDLISYLKGELDIKLINGLIYKDLEANIIANPSRQLITDIDSIPMPSYNLFRMSAYPHHRMVSSRGCPFNCVFCNSKAIWTNRWRKRSPGKLIEEIEYLVKNFGSKTFVLNDDSFNIDAKRVNDLCGALIARNINILWSASARADLISREMAQKLKSAGCYDVSIGIESANNAVLERINKNTTHELILSGIRNLRAAGIDVLGQFMIGNPGDTLETIKESIDFARNSDLTGVEFYTALPYKGSSLWDFVQQHGRMLGDVEAYNYHNISPRIIFDTPEFPEKDIIKAIDLARAYGYYNALSKDRSIPGLNFGRKLSSLIQQLFKGKVGNNIYLLLRKIYRKL
ncbi:MAG: radical SAM protein [Bacteroidales bacterium]|nr:radical SAM protein [Bacteroidales bacterium]